MSSAIAILTYNRIGPLQKTFGSVMQTKDRTSPVAIFEDCGQSDATRAWLRNNVQGERIESVLATRYTLSKSTAPSRVEAFLGDENLGVAGNSNRALWWFMNHTTADHLMLCNDDIEFVGDATALYRTAHESTGIGLFCFCDFDSEQFKCTPVLCRGTKLKKLSRMTGMMMSITRKLVESIGYMDPQFGPFGEDHCDFTVRARCAGHQAVNGQDLYCLDVEQPEPPLLKHQVVASCIDPNDKPHLDAMANAVMVEKSKAYHFSDAYLAYSLKRNHLVDSINGRGTMADALLNHINRPH
jgi:GT2 family glycosyltransferase